MEKKFFGVWFGRYQKLSRNFRVTLKRYNTKQKRYIMAYWMMKTVQRAQFRKRYDNVVKNT